jgi:hypothetical protein
MSEAMTAEELAKTAARVRKFRQLQKARREESTDGRRNRRSKKAECEKADTTGNEQVNGTPEEAR